MKLTAKEGRGWPNYILWGRVRTSTAALIVAFIGIWWLYATYQPAPPAAAGTDHPGGAAGLHPRPVLHLGAAHPGATAHHHDDADDHRDHAGDDDHLARESPTSPTSPTSPASPTPSTTTTPAPPGLPPSPGAPSPSPQPSPAPARADVDARGSDAIAATQARLHWRAVMITLDHVSKQYKSAARPALDNVSVKIDKGEFVFLIGPSGSGQVDVHAAAARRGHPDLG